MMSRVSRRQVLELAGVGLAAASCRAGGVTYSQRASRHYKELTAEDKRQLIERLEAEAFAQSGVRVEVADPPPIRGVRFAFALDLAACNGNRRCVEACARENNLPDEPALRYIRLLEIPRGALSLREGQTEYDDTVPRADRQYVPVQCQQCDDPPCVRVCPVQATWKEPDGLVVIDYEWCIGCRYCMVACPYDARRFNFVEPQVPPDQLNPNQALLSNRLRPAGVTEKCTFCLQRVRRGQYPACVEACPTGARKFGDLNDPASEIRRILEQKRVMVLEEQLGTVPRFFYYMG
jgi:molybdopterin-containing oxidoreductase family iron-sulfur binding subunit